MMLQGTNCLFHGCNLEFSSVEDLIYHVEESHVPSAVLVAQAEPNDAPQTVHLSCISRYCNSDKLEKRRVSQIDDELSSFFSKRRRSDCTDTEEYFDEYVLESDTPCPQSPGSHGSLFQFEMPTPPPCGDMFLRRDSNSSVSGSSFKPVDDSEKPYVCPIPGCGKRYKNPNGIKYHTIHGHTNEVLLKKPYKCYLAGCCKRYKNTSGLKQHFNQSHPNEVMDIERSIDLPFGLTLNDLASELAM
eukprot:comp17349_c0_seq1/m.16615 comp17349_c0_seq1/g.16615  ORF comp17349_c0_seq1/g.16615 comp17349_c0_seq1/m.16615 type:complete len:244 (-) comp17349_c0_seq1:319-1050(-)